VCACALACVYMCMQLLEKGGTERKGWTGAPSQKSGRVLHQSRSQDEQWHPSGGQLLLQGDSDKIDSHIKLCPGLNPRPWGTSAPQIRRDAHRGREVEEQRHANGDIEQQHHHWDDGTSKGQQEEGFPPIHVTPDAHLGCLSQSIGKI
jgi:hypothetical protein